MSILVNYGGNPYYVPTAGEEGWSSSLTQLLVAMASSSPGSISIGTANGLSISGSVLSLALATASHAGAMGISTQTFSGDKTFLGSVAIGGTISATNFSGSNTGDVTLGAIGSAPNANGSSLAGQLLTLQPANASFGGIVTTAAQTFAGVKTFSSAISLPSGVNTPAGVGILAPGIPLAISAGSGAVSDSGTGDSGGTGGAITISAGIGGSDVFGLGAGSGGALTFNGGTGGATNNGGPNGNGGSLSFNGGAGTTPTNPAAIGGEGGSLTFLAGAAGTGANGGNVLISAGAAGTGDNAGNAGTVTIASANGGAINQDFTAAGNGGAFTFVAGDGGANAGTAAGGAGGSISLTSGSAGIASGVRSNNAGSIYFDTGAASTVGTAPIDIGTTNAKAVTIGRTGKTVSFPGIIAVTGAISASNLSGTNTGDQTSVTGNAGTATALQTARTINGVSFNGTANIVVVDSAAVVANVAITGATKTKITYDTKGLVTAGANATTADIADSTDKRYVTDANVTVIGNTSGTNSGNVTLGAVGSTPSANGASLSGQVLTLQPADGSQPGLITTGAQTIAGAKTLTGQLFLGTTTGATSFITPMMNAATATPTNAAFMIMPNATLDATDCLFSFGTPVGAFIGMQVFGSGKTNFIGDVSTGASSDLLAGRLVSSGSATGTDSFKGLNGGKWNMSTADTNAYLARTSTDLINTPGKLTATTGLGVGNSAAATTLGTVVKKMEVFSATGVSLGFIPIYDAIT